jgi:multidrug efflux pump
VLAVFFVPVFFVVVRRVFKGSERQRLMYAQELQRASGLDAPPMPDAKGPG